MSGLHNPLFSTMKSYTLLCLKNLELCAYNTILTLLIILSIIFH